MSQHSVPSLFPRSPRLCSRTLLLALTALAAQACGTSKNEGNAPGVDCDVMPDNAACTASTNGGGKGGGTTGGAGGAGGMGTAGTGAKTDAAVAMGADAATADASPFGHIDDNSLGQNTLDRDGGTAFTTPGAPLKPLEGISRTMNLLATSTPTKKHTVRILVYGQSISKQEWSGMVVDDLKRRYPNAEIIYENRSIGGFESDRLKFPAEQDIFTFAPDLVMFTVYGGSGSMMDIMAMIRSRSSAEILWNNHHVTAGFDSGLRKQSTTVIPPYAKNVGAEFVDLTAAWDKLLNGRDPNAYLADGTHLNGAGNVEYAKIIEAALKYDPATKVDPLGLVKTYAVGSDVNWAGNKLTLEFTGNRVDVVAGAGAGGGTAEVTIDGKKPSEFNGAYAFTRPNPNVGDWPWQTGTAVRVLSMPTALRQVEEWTITTTGGAGDVWNFTVSGSKTGADGSGKSGMPFTSTSGRVHFDGVIEMVNGTSFYREWFLTDPTAHRTTVSAGSQIKFNSIAMHNNQYPPAAGGFKLGNEYTTLFTGIPNGKHTLVLTAAGTPPSIAEIRVHKPPVVFK